MDQQTRGKIFSSSVPALVLFTSHQRARVHGNYVHPGTIYEQTRKRERIGLYENNKISPIIIQPRASLFDLSDPLRRANRYFALRYPTVQDFDSRHLTRSFCRSKRATYHKLPFSRRSNEFSMLILLEYFNNWYPAQSYEKEKFSCLNR